MADLPRDEELRKSRLGLQAWSTSLGSNAEREASLPVCTRRAALSLENLSTAARRARRREWLADVPRLRRSRCRRRTQPDWRTPRASPRRGCRSRSPCAYLPAMRARASGALSWSRTPSGSRCRSPPHSPPTQSASRRPFATSCRCRQRFSRTTGLG